MSLNVVNFPTDTSAESANDVLEGAKDNFESVVIIGWNKEGILDASASTNLRASDVNWLIDTFKQQLLLGNLSDV